MSEKENEGNCVKRLFFFLFEHALFPAAIAFLVFYFSYYIEFYDRKDQFILNLKLILPEAKSAIEQNIRKIEANRSSLQNHLSLNTIDALPGYNLIDIIKYVEDTNVVLSLNFVNQCFHSYNTILVERNTIYSSLIDGHAVTPALLNKEERLEKLSPKCLEWLAKAQCQLHLLYEQKANTKIKPSDCQIGGRVKMDDES